MVNMVDEVVVGGGGGRSQANPGLAREACRGVPYFDYKCRNMTTIICIAQTNIFIYIQQQYI